MVLHHRGFPIRKSTGQRLFPPHRGLSQVIASFFGSQCQGIHLMLFFAWTAFSFSLNSWILGNFKLFCLSFANNCFLGCKLKDLFGFIIHWFLSALVSLLMLTKLFSHFFCTEKPILKIKINNKFFSIYNYLFRFIVSLFGFQWALRTFVRW